MPHRAGFVRRTGTAAVASIVVMALLVGAGRSRPGGRRAAPDRYRLPVDAPVVDGFRPPTTPYGPGNRGLEYAHRAGTEVRAAAGGRVTFAGQVAGTRHVDGAPRRRVAHHLLVPRSHRRAGRPAACGRAGGRAPPLGRLHLSARSGDLYLDPAALFAAGPPQVRLVPFDEPPGPGPLGGAERHPPAPRRPSAAASAGRGRRRCRARPRGAPRSRGRRWRRDARSTAQLLRTLAHYAPVRLLADPVSAPRSRRRPHAWTVAHRACTASDAGRAAGRAARGRPRRRSRLHQRVAPRSTTSTSARSDTTPATCCASATRAGARPHHGGRVRRHPGDHLRRSGLAGRPAPSGERLADLVEAVAARPAALRSTCSPTRRVAWWCGSR